jgi:hypothetical protein
LSTSERLSFEPWLKSAFADTGGFTALIVLVRIGEAAVTPVVSTYVHAIGDDLSWKDFSNILSQSRRKWDGVVIFCETDGGKGPVPDALARNKLRQAELRIADDRLAINDGHFFDARGRRMRIDEIEQATEAP